MQTVKDILNTKGHDVWSVDPQASVLDALRLMATKEVGAVLVLDGDRLTGILTERDYARKVVLAGRSSKDSPVGDVMTTEVLCVSPAHNVEECMTLMTEKRLRHLPVVEHERVVGIVSIGDLVKATIDDKELTISQLQRYITG